MSRIAKVAWVIGSVGVVAIVGGVSAPQASPLVLQVAPAVAITKIRNETHPKAPTYNQEKPLALPGDVIVIEGRGFGKQGKGRFVRFAAPLRTPATLQVLSWTDTRIRARVAPLSAYGWSDRELKSAKAGARMNGTITLVGLEVPPSPLSVIFGLKELDLDGDGYFGLLSGGADCDDFEPQRYAGAVEICDVRHVDEDCDPTTFGSRDQDGDGAIAASCRNVSSTGEVFAGTDCNDQNPNAHPRAQEVCDGIDNNCNGGIDEDLLNCRR